MGDEEFGDYVLHEVIGRGGMGEVYRATDTRRRRVVAVKRLQPLLTRDAVYRERFRTESEVAARLTEPHVLPIHDFGEIDGHLFIDMRFVEGPDLGSLLARDGALPVAEAVDILGQIASALDAAHGDDLVHRDVKPQNVLVSADGASDGPRFAYLTDFGVAQIGGADTSMSSTNTTAGTLDYMAPERFGARRASHLVDVYSLGCVFYEMLTGDRPFRTSSMPEAMHAHVYEVPPRPSDHRPDLARAFDALVARAMAKDPDDRYPSCGELAAAARACLRGAAGAQTLDDGPASTLVPEDHPSKDEEDVALAAPQPEPDDGGGGEHAVETEGTPRVVASRTDDELARRRHTRRTVVLAGAAAAVLGIVLAAVPVVGGGSVSGSAAADAAPAAAVAPQAASPVPAVAPVPLDATFTGRSSGDEVTVALATRNGQVAAYLCDGDSVEAWLEGTVTDRRLRIASPSGAALEATLTDDAAFGTMMVKGEVLPFSARVAPAPAGLYEARSGSTRIGWIVLADGEQIGIARTGDQRRPAPALDVAAMRTEVDGAAVPAEPVVAGGPGGWG